MDQCGGCGKGFGSSLHRVSNGRIRGTQHMVRDVIRFLLVRIVRRADGQLSLIVNLGLRGKPLGLDELGDSSIPDGALQMENRVAFGLGSSRVLVFRVERWDSGDRWYDICVFSF